MPPVSNPKMLGELHTAAALRKDVCSLLLHFVSAGDLSFAHFKHIWKARNFGSIHTCKVDKFGYKSYLQLLFEAVLLLLQSDNSFEGEIMAGAPPLNSIADETTRKNVWNIGIIYCIYTVYNTQPLGETNKVKSPVSIGVETAISLATAARRLCTLAEFGRTAVSMYQSLLKVEAFRYCMYTGPTCMFYCQKVKKSSSTSVVPLNPMAELIESANRIATGTTANTSSSTGENSSSCNRQVVDFAAVDMIRRHFSLGTTRTVAPPPLEQSNHSNVNHANANESDNESESENDANSIISSAPHVSATKPTAAVADAETEITALFEPPAQSVTEYLAQSIPARRQMRADRAQKRLDKQQALEDARVERLRARVLKRLEKHDVAVPVQDTSKHTTKEGSKLRNSRRNSSQTSAPNASTSGQRSPPVAENVEVFPPRRTTRPGSSSSALPAASAARTYVLDHAEAALATMRPKGRSGRKASATEPGEMVESVEAPRLMPRASHLGRHLAEAHAEHDDALQENEDLMQDFEEFVGLRSKPARPTAVAAHTQNPSTARSTRSTARPAEPRTSPEPEDVHLDPATDDIMEILNQLEKDSQHVLQRRSQRSGAIAGAAAEPASSSVPQVCRTAVVTGASVQPKLRRPPVQNVPLNRNNIHAGADSSGGLSRLELRDVNKRKKASAADRSAPAAKKVKTTQPAIGDAEPAAESQDVMVLLQRLEQESQRILTGAEEDDSDDREEPKSPVQRRRRGAANTNINTSTASAVRAAAAAPRRVATKRSAAPLLETTLSSEAADWRSTRAAPPAKKQHLQRAAPSTKITLSAVAPTASRESDDIMAVLQRLEQESDQVLTSAVSTTRDGIAVPIDDTLHTAVEARIDQEENAAVTGVWSSRAAEKDTPVSLSLKPQPQPKTRKSNRHIGSNGHTSGHDVATAEVPVKASTMARSARKSNAEVPITNLPADSIRSAHDNECEVVSATPAPAADSNGGEGGMDIMEMLRQLEEEASAVLNG